MRFLQLHVHGKRYFNSVVVQATFNSVSFAPPTVDCPRCGWTYFAETAQDLNPHAAEAWQYLAAWRLARECPDHAHAFAVGRDVA